MKHFIQATTLMGVVLHKQSDNHCFTIRSRAGDEYRIRVKEETDFRCLTNLDGINHDRFDKFVDQADPRNELKEKIETYIHENTLVAVQAIYQVQGDKSLFDASCVHLLTTQNSTFLFEQSHWWLNQISILADEWLDDLFKDRRDYSEADFSELYRTNLNIIGLPTDNEIQEMATLSRLIYGLSSAYLLRGNARYLSAASAGIRFQREAFRSLSHDGKNCFWAYGRRRQKYGTEWKLLSEDGTDAGTIPLYEQIYALAGLAQYYRITNDWEVLEDIRRTVRTFNDFYLDDKKNNTDFPGKGGYFSHLDYATMRPDSDALGEDKNKSRKNWNSIGDHIPAYLINILLALDPLPVGRESDLDEFLTTCREILNSCTKNIITHFPDKVDSNIPYVNERFKANWDPEQTWDWQKNQAIVGHNLKIAWNLTRVANYYLATNNSQDAEKALTLAKTLTDNMLRFGLDPVRGGVFDAVERDPHRKNGNDIGNDMDFEFTWSSTKDFWQQEQGILAYLILYGQTGKQEYLDAAREIMAFWNLFFLDRDNRGIFFRVMDIGTPVIEGKYSQKAEHAIAGYHSFELNYLAHLYIRSLVGVKPDGDEDFCLYFHLATNNKQRSINVLPDYFPPGRIKISSITVNGNLGRSVTSNEMARKVKDIDDPNTEQGKKLDSPISLAEWFPERPYWSDPQFVRMMEIYNARLKLAEERLNEFDALVIVGGSGPIVDLANNQRVHDLILGFYRQDKPIVAECYGVACLAFARNIENRKSIIWGKRVTGHCLEYDYKDGTGFMESRGKFLDFNMGPPPYPLEYILRDATGPDGAYIGNFGHPTSVIVDYPFITGRSTPDSYLTGQKLIEVLDGEPPLRQWG